MALGVQGQWNTPGFDGIEAAVHPREESQNLVKKIARNVSNFAENNKNGLSALLLLGLITFYLLAGVSDKGGFNNSHAWEQAGKNLMLISAGVALVTTVAIAAFTVYRASQQPRVGEMEGEE